MIEKIEIIMPGSDLPHSGAGNPQLPRKNEYFKVGKRGRGASARGTLVKTKTAEIFISRLGGRLIRMGYNCSRHYPLIDSGDWILQIVAFAVRRREKDVDRPDLDADACIMPVQDALMATGVIKDDSLLACSMGLAFYRKRDPGIEIRLWRAHAHEAMERAAAMGQGIPPELLAMRCASR